MTSISKIDIEKVFKLFGPVRALAGVSLSIKSGEAAAIMGGNGAGKSTLLSLLSLSLKPTQGRILFNDQLIEDSSAWRGRIGFLAHDPMLYPDLSAEENLLFFAGLLGIPHPRQSVERRVEEMALGEFFSDRPCRVLSRGQLQRVSLSRALLADPDLLLLDEPAAGLDSKAVGRIEKAVVDLLAQGGMAVVVTHEPEVAASFATRAVMLRRGKIVEDTRAPSSADLWRSLYLKSQEGSSP
jgi:heme exporter protein A